MGMPTLEQCRKAMGEHAKDWPDSKVEEFQRRADILTDIVIEMYQAGRAPGRWPRRGRWCQTTSATSWKSGRRSRSMMLTYREARQSEWL